MVFQRQEVLICRGELHIPSECIVAEGARDAELFYLSIDCKKLKTMSNGLDYTNPSSDMKLICTVCAESNIVKSPHDTVRTRATRPLEIVHVDVGGAVSPER